MDYHLGPGPTRTEFEEELATKLSINQGSENAGKFMIVDNSGDIVPTTVPFAEGVSF